MKKNKLPQFYVVKRPDNWATNPKWKEFVEKFNLYHRVNYSGDMWTYYGYDGSDRNRGTECHDDVFHFENNPTVLTLDQWFELFNSEVEEFERGDKVKVWDNDSLSKRDATYIFDYYSEKLKKHQFIVELDDAGIKCAIGYDNCEKIQPDPQPEPIELTLDEIAAKLNIDVKLLKIKK